MFRPWESNQGGWKNDERFRSRKSSSHWKTSDWSWMFKVKASCWLVPNLILGL